MTVDYRDPYWPICMTCWGLGEVEVQRGPVS